MRTLIAGLVLGLLVAGCGSPAASSSASPGPTSSGAGATIDPAWVTRPAYGCGDAAPFPPEALGGPIGAETGSDAAAVALRTELQGAAPEMGLPLGGWRRVLETPELVMFVAVGNEAIRWHVVAFMRTGDGGWTLERMGQCDLHVVLPDPEVEVAAWWPDPDRAAEAGATTIPILVLERACASGQDATGRILEPSITSSDAAVIVILAVRHREDGGDCTGSPPTPFLLQLPEPLGGRVLLDGGIVPPAEPVPAQ